METPEPGPGEAALAWEVPCLYYRGAFVGALTEKVEETPGERRFAAVNTRLVIFPDKKLLDLSDGNRPRLEDMEVSLTTAAMTFRQGTGETVPEGGAPSARSTVTFTVDGDRTGALRIGDGIEISGIRGSLAENNRTVIIRELETETVREGETVTGTVFTVAIRGTPFVTDTDGQGGPAETVVTGELRVERRIPDLDFICESGNRLWGCSNRTGTIYASVLGDPSNFYVYDGLSTDGYALPVAGEGAFTGCCRLSSSLLFWKEDRLHKVIGDYPAEYVMYTYQLEGLRAGCHKSMQILNDVLFYVGLHGVFAYAGGTPADVSRALGDHVLTEAAAGTDGETYYLSCLDNGTPAFYVYSPDREVWLKEDETWAADFVRDGTDVVFLDREGTVWLEDAGEPEEELDWSLTFPPFRETPEGRKRLARLLIRAELPEGAWLEARVACDGGRAEPAGRILGRGDDVSQLWIRPNRCDRFQVTLSGHGPCVIRNVLREFTVGGPG